MLRLLRNWWVNVNSDWSSFKKQLESALIKSIQCVYSTNNTEIINSVVSVPPRVVINVSIEAAQWLVKFRIATCNHHNKHPVFTTTTARCRESIAFWSRLVLRWSISLRTLVDKTFYFLEYFNSCDMILLLASPTDTNHGSQRTLTTRMWLGRGVNCIHCWLHQQN